MAVELVTRSERLAALEQEWDAAFAAARDPSPFNSHTYVVTAWRHFGKAGKSLFIVVVRRDGAIAGIAPWYLGDDWVDGERGRTIRSIGLLEGDNPDIIAVAEPASVWAEILDFLCAHRGVWEILRLSELPSHSAALQYDFPGLGRYHRRIRSGHECYSVALNGSWDSYLRERPGRVRRAYLRRLRRLEGQLGPPSYPCFRTPETIGAGLERFIAVEQVSWKRGAGLGVSRSPAIRAFFADLLPALAGKGAAEVSLLCAGGEDIAGEIVYLTGDTIYSKEIAYDPRFAAFSPGTLLLAHQIETGIARGYRTLDMMGMTGVSGRQQKQDWATARQTIVQWTVCNRGPLVLGRAQRLLARLFGRGVDPQP